MEEKNKRDRASAAKGLAPFAFSAKEPSGSEPGAQRKSHPSADVINTIKKPIVVLKQTNGRYLYLSENAAVIINQNGKLISTYGVGNFDANITNVLKAAGH